MENILNQAKSLYLVRHASNPVPWQLWDNSVFQAAERLNRPVFLSIGYSSCHWCRVMEKESFDDPETAAILADKFIPVKMDKDEYPDIDKKYQFYLQSTGEQGGWPLNVFLTPNGEPFFAGSYFPKERIGNRPAFKEVLLNIHKIFSENQQEIRKVINTGNEFLKTFNTVSESIIPENLVKKYRISEFKKIFDKEYYGFRDGAKFPYMPAMNYLLDNIEEAEYSDFVKKTADTICVSGINDHLFGGFFRYTSDRKWSMPHFEKMLSDNAQIISFLMGMYEKTGNKLYSYSAQKAMDFILYGDMRSDFGYLESLDADSLNAGGAYEEGYFYRVTDRDFSVLNENELRNFPNEAGIDNGVIRLKHSEYIKFAALEPTLKKAADRISAVKSHPQPDNKALSGTNFMLCSALLKCYEAMSEDYYLEQALSLFHKIRNISVSGGIVYRGLYVSEDEINGNLGKNEDAAAVFKDFIINHRTLSDHVYYLEAALKFYEIYNAQEFLHIAESVAAEIEKTFVKDGIPYLDINRRVCDTFDDDKPNPAGFYLYLTVKYSDKLNIKPDDRFVKFAIDRAARFPTGHPTIIRALELAGK